MVEPAPVVQAQMFVTSAPSQGRLQNLNRKKNWDDSEDECLCRAWIKAVEQHKAPEHKSAEFWRIVTELFQKTTPRDEERSDDACNQRFNNLSRACTKWLLARETVVNNPLNTNKDDDQIADLVQEAYKRLMNTDKSFKNFRALDILKNSEKWQEHSHALSLRTREAVANGQLSATPKTARIPPIGQSKMKLGRYEPPGPSLDFQRMSTMLAQVQSALSTSLERHSEAQRDLGEKLLHMGNELGKKLDTLSEVLLIRNLPEAEKKILIDAQLKHRMRSLETAEQEERKRKLMTEIEVLELETRKKVMLESQAKTTAM